MHSNCRMSPFHGRPPYDRSDSVPYERQQHHRPMRPNEPPSCNRVPDTTVPSAPGTPETMCYNGAASFRANPPADGSLLSLLTSNEQPAGSYFTPPPPPPLAASISPSVGPPAPIQQPLPHDPSEQVVVKDGCIFYIRYVDEPEVAEDVPVVRSNGEEFSESLPSIANELSMLLDDSAALADGGHPSLADEHSAEVTARDWINYDELPLLNQQKLQQPVPIADHVTRRSSGTARVETERCKDCHKPARANESRMTYGDVCWCSATPGMMSPLEANLSFCSPEPPTPTNAATMVPDFSYYCVECEKFFPTNECLQEHMELNHRLIDESLPVVTSIPRAAYAAPEVAGASAGYAWPCLSVVDSSNQCAKMPFFCDLCSISFNQADSYYLHNYSVHAGLHSSHYR
uniref:C2H2-type domain-containing protein n=1 Tax=Anopheles coluzzii TaxID=1518534 RepID=A0A6E8VMM4_ANOCL